MTHIQRMTLKEKLQWFSRPGPPFTDEEWKHIQWEDGAFGNKWVQLLVWCAAMGLCLLTLWNRII